MATSNNRRHSARDIPSDNISTCVDRAVLRTRIMKLAPPGWVDAPNSRLRSRMRWFPPVLLDLDCTNPADTDDMYVSELAVFAGEFDGCDVSNINRVVGDSASNGLAMFPMHVIEPAALAEEGKPYVTDI